MRPYRLTRPALASAETSAASLVLAQDVRDASGRVVAGKGSPLTSEMVQRLATVDWSELHAIALDPGDVHEIEAVGRLVRAVAGRDVEVGTMTAGHWPLHAAVRGVVQIDVDALREINELDGIALYSLFDGQVVEQRETVARGKIVPFAIAAETLARAERVARRREGAVHVRRFVPLRVGAVIQESLGDRAMARAHAVLAEKIGWFGSTLIAPRFVTSSSSELAAQLRDLTADAGGGGGAGGAQLLVVAGSRPMDPLDPVFEALARIGARIERQGVPAHPGSLLWLGYLNAGDRERTIVGLPSCGLFSQASVFDLLMPRLLAGERLTNASLAQLGHGGLLTRDMQFRFPPYRSGARRGEVLDE